MLNLFSIINLALFSGLLFVLFYLRRQSLTLSRQVFVGLLLGVAFGFYLQVIYGVGSPVMAETLQWTNMVGDAYVNLLRMIVMPLILITMMAAVLRMDAIASVQH
jgi:L-cystine uptake protein TcyP (sodium:dicarboxylate symporter family)